MGPTLTVVTALCGMTNDKLRQIVAPADPAGRPVQWLCFSDRYHNSRTLHGTAHWEMRTPPWDHDNPRRTAKYPKVMIHRVCGPETTYSLWIDSTHQFKVNPWSLVDYMTGKQLAAFKHPDRDTVSAEASACVALGKDNPEIIAAQLQRYTEAGFDDRRLFECSMILREHTTAVADFNNLWWDEIQRGSVRDQLSMPWALAHSKPVWGYIPGCRTHSPWCNFYEHGSK